MASATAPLARLFSREEFQQLVDSGFFAGEKVELLDGTVISTSPQNTPHAATVNRLNYQLMKLCGPEVYIRVQSPVVLCVPDPVDYADAHPRPEQIFLIIEVADANVWQDRQYKARLYASNGIPHYWVVELRRRRIEAMSSPDSFTGQYGRVRTFRSGQTLTLPHGQKIAVSDILPPKR